MASKSDKVANELTQQEIHDLQDETMREILAAHMTCEAKCIVLAMILMGKQTASFNDISKALNSPNGEIAMGSVSLRAAGLNVASPLVFDVIKLPDGIV